MSMTSFGDENALFLAELIGFRLQSDFQAAARSQGSAHRQSGSRGQPLSQQWTLSLFEGEVASVRLRRRDWHELASMFDLENISDIEADILSHLDRLWPEPCWEEDPFDFLRDYL